MKRILIIICFMIVAKICFAYPISVETHDEIKELASDTVRFRDELIKIMIPIRESNPSRYGLLNELRDDVGSLGTEIEVIYALLALERIHGQDRQTNARAILLLSDTLKPNVI